MMSISPDDVRRVSGAASARGMPRLQNKGETDYALQALPQSSYRRKRLQDRGPQLFELEDFGESDAIDRLREMVSPRRNSLELNQTERGVAKMRFMSMVKSTERMSGQIGRASDR